MLSALFLATLLAVRAGLTLAPPTPGPLVLVPDRFEVRAGEQIRIGLQGTDGGALDWGGHPTTWTFVRVAGTQENFDRFPGTDAGPARIALATPGVTMLCAEFAPTTLVMTRAELDTTLGTLVTDAEREKVLSGLVADRVRVRVTAGAKSLVRTLTQEGSQPAIDAQTAGSKSGQFNEVRVLLDPINSLVGGDISVRFHADYDKAARARATATNLDTGQSQALTSDASGIALFHLDEPGRWRVAFTTARPAPKGDSVDVILYSASLTFANTNVGAPK